MKDYCALCGKDDVAINTLIDGMSVFGIEIGCCDEHAIQKQNCVKAVKAKKAKS